MPGFSSYDDITNALSVLGTGQELFFTKTAPAAQVAGAFHTGWAYTGIPTAGTWVGSGGSTSATFVTCNNATVGAIGVVSPTSASATNPYITTVGAMPTTSVAGTLMLVDRLADSGALTTSLGGSCTFTMPGGGWARHNTGVGVMAYIEALGTASSANINFALNYTNQAGTASRVSGTVVTAAGAHRAFGTSGPFFNLQGTDTGLRSIESATVSVTSAANVALVVCKPLLMVPCVTANYYSERDFVIQTPKLPKLEVSADTTACLQWLFFAGGATTPTLIGSVSTVTG